MRPSTQQQAGVAINSKLAWLAALAQGGHASIAIARQHFGSSRQNRQRCSGRPTGGEENWSDAKHYSAWGYAADQIPDDHQPQSGKGVRADDPADTARARRREY